VEGAQKGASFAKFGGIIFGSLAFIGGAFLFLRAKYGRKQESGGVILSGLSA
jgi:hypothetical protein